MKLWWWLLRCVGRDYTAVITCDGLPNQIVGRYRGRAFYFRARNGYAAVYWTDASGQAIDPPVARLPHPDAGYWSPTESLALCEYMVRRYT